MKRYLFLDVDGVLNHPGTWGKRPSVEAIDRDKTIRLSALVEKLDLHIVISSSWKHMHTIEEMRQMLHTRGLRHAATRVVSMTPHAFEFDHDSRGAEITVWLKLNAPDAHYAILDDMDLDSFEGLGEHLIQTDGSIGLTDRDCARVERCLERQHTAQ
jgi:hypothetical protein